MDGECDMRWSHLQKILLRPLSDSSKLRHPGFSPGPENLQTVHVCKVLIVGAGGLGCELLKDLAMMGFRNLHLIDMDTIEMSNLNRQFLFREKDVGQFKAEVAAEFVRKRRPDCSVTAYCCRIEDKEMDFYKSFNLIVCGLDSVQARRWLNAMLCDILEFDEDGNLDQSSIIPLIDGGTEGFKGNARIILPGLTPCVECTLDLYPPQVNFPLCTIAHTPRLPEHCIEYVRVLLWPKEKPFDVESIDGDDPDHIKWIYERSTERAKEYKIDGVTLRLTQGVVKHIMPAVASTNAVIAAACAQECFKLATNCTLPLDNYMNFQDIEGVSCSVVQLAIKEDCPVCSRKPVKLKFARSAKFQELFDYFCNSPEFQLKSPGIYLGGKPLYVPNVPPLKLATKSNLKLPLCELGLADRTNLIVADVTRPTSLTVELHLVDPMDE